MAFQLGNLLGLFAFSVLIPFIIIYLIKPKPEKLKVPSLMFFLSKTQATTRTKFFRFLERNILFIIQLLVLLLLAFSLADPLILIRKDVVSTNIVFVLDASASSKTLEDGKTRFEISKEKIKELATTKNSLVLIKSTPVLALNDAGKSELIRYIDLAQPTDDLSDIAGGITLAGEILGERKGRIVVLSDFIHSKGISPEVSKNVLESKGIAVDIINTKISKRNNLGIINMALSDNSANIYIKNYNEKEETAKIKIGNQAQEVKIAPGSVEPIVIKLEGNGSEIKIENQDDFLVDNTVYITRPFEDKIKILLITNGDSKYVKAALSSIQDVTLTVTEPPVTPKETYDIYIVSQVKKENLLPGTFKELKEKAENGKTVIVTAQVDTDKIDYEGLIPEIINYTNGGSTKINHVTRFSKDMEFGDVRHYFILENEGLSIASTQNNSIISLYENEKGRVVYYGILESESDFELNPNYPIFWNNLIYYSVGRAELNEINLKTGSIIEAGNEHFIMDKAGYFNLGSKRIAVNLLNEKESDINHEEEIKKEYIQGKLEKIESEVDYSLSLYLVVIALLLAIAEYFYIKSRGEI